TRPSTRDSQRAFSWIRTHPYTMFATLVFLGLAVPFLLRKDSEWDEVYVRAAGHLLNGQDIYDPRDGYSYPPFMAWLAIPFTYLPHWGLRLTWYAVNVVCLVALGHSAWRVAGGKALEGEAAPARREHLICLLGLACALRYSFDAISHQQTDLMVGA